MAHSEWANVNGSGKRSTLNPRAGGWHKGALAGLPEVDSATTSRCHSRRDDRLAVRCKGDRCDLLHLGGKWQRAQDVTALHIGKDDSGFRSERQRVSVG